MVAHAQSILHVIFLQVAADNTQFADGMHGFVELV